ncbi:MAG: helix-turn-helix transcriptional regulator [Bacteriovoracaceae bacterium]|nr:helix-turn-helix transcriptional regulator [Bacteriovoracaceae bacterium]
MNDNIDKEIQEFTTLMAKLIRENRIKVGATQVDLADKIGINQSTISKIEAGKLQVSTYHWVKICESLNIPFDLVMKEVSTSNN